MGAAGCDDDVYNAPVGEIDLTGAAVWTDMAIIHEYAHYLEAHIGSFLTLPSTHDGCSATIAGANVSSPELAWMEGFADWFAQAVNRAAPDAQLSGSWDPSGYGTPTMDQLDSPFCALPPGTPRGSVENYVAGVLWDLTDNASGEPWDTASGWDTQIFQMMDRELDSANLGGGAANPVTTWSQPGGLAGCRPTNSPRCWPVTRWSSNSKIEGVLAGL